MTTISCKNVSKTYAGGLAGPRQYALKELNLQVEEGEVFGMVGPNGAGKSTILKILMGFIRPDTGTAFLSNCPAGSPESRGIVGYLPENPCLYRHLTVTDHLQFAARAAGMTVQKTRERVDEILKEVDLTDVAQNPLHSFSKGMTQRAAMAYALFLKPDILILDEPMSGLDPLGRYMMVDIIKQYREAGATVLFCSHILADVEHICTRISILDKGEIRATTSPEELLTMDLDTTVGATRLESFFLKTISTDMH